MAKLFKVYCFEYSIGFGPALFRRKRKGGETYVAIRAIPFGGYVSMYGEQVEDKLPDGITSIDPKRSLNNISKWKRAIIMVAGVTLNALLALTLFFIASFLPQQQLYLRNINVTEGSIAAEAGLTEDSILYLVMPETDAEGKPLPDDEAYIASKEGYYILDRNTLITYNDDTTGYAAMMIDTAELSFKNRDYQDLLVYYPVIDDKINYANAVKPVDTIKSITSTLYEMEVQKIDGEDVLVKIDNPIEIVRHVVKVDNKLSFEDLGLKVYLETKKNNFKEATEWTFDKFGNNALLLFKTIGGLFKGDNVAEVGGLIYIYQESATIMLNYNASYFLQLWGIISINLAIMNLLPFPGLDGWQLLVLFVESIAHREVPQKAKAIISIVGIGLLFLLMGLILVKDIIGLF